MDRNASMVQDIQEKINRIIDEAPKLFDRLDVVMPANVVYGLLCDQEPPLQLLQPLRVNMPYPHPVSVLTGVVTNRTLENKQSELKQLTEEVVILFKRIQNVLNWNTVCDICHGHGRIVILPEEHRESLRILDVYCDHLEALYEEELREELLQELDSSSSSIDSYSR